MIDRWRSFFCTLAAGGSYSDDEYVRKAEFDPAFQMQIKAAKFVERSIRFEQYERVFLDKLDPFDRFMTRLGHYLLPHRYLYFRFPVGDRFRKEVQDGLVLHAGILKNGYYNGRLQDSLEDPIPFQGECERMIEFLKKSKDRDLLISVSDGEITEKVHRDATLGKIALSVTVVALAGFGTWYATKENS